MKNDFQKAVNVCLRLFKYRLRSKKELEDRLRQKGFSRQAISKAVRYFEEIGLIDDRTFAQAWIDARINKGLGSVRIKKELAEKGIAAELAESLIEDKLRETSLNEQAAKLIEARFKTTVRQTGREKAKKRFFTFLVRRGFPYDIAYEEVKKAFDDD